MGTNRKQKYFFREGEEVFHIDNPSQKMYVERVVLKLFKRPSLKDPEVKENATKIMGIRCHWWKEKEFNTCMFHKSELVPFSMSDDSYADIQRWIAEYNS